MNPGYLKLFTWTKDFNPSSLKQTFAQVWIHIHSLSQEYWRPKIDFAIASSIRTPFCTDFAIIESCFDRPFGHYVRVLVDLDLYNELRYKILVEIKGYAFFVEIEYENLPNFCSVCCCIGHNLDKCRKNKVGVDQDTVSLKTKKV